MSFVFGILNHHVPGTRLFGEVLAEDVGPDGSVGVEERAIAWGRKNLFSENCISKRRSERS